MSEELEAAVEAYIAFHRRRYRMLVDLLERNVAGPVPRALDVGGASDALGLGTFVRDHFGAEAHAVALGHDVEIGQQKGLCAKECNVDRDPLPYEDAFFDLVIFASVIEHLYHPRFAIKEMARVTRPGGLLLLEAPNAVSIGRRVKALMGANPFQWFNEYNAIHPNDYMLHCSIFYTREEAEQIIAPEFETIDRAYGVHTPPRALPKKILHETLTRLFPRMSDCFAIVARRI